MKRFVLGLIVCLSVLSHLSAQELVQEYWARCYYDGNGDGQDLILVTYDDWGTVTDWNYIVEHDESWQQGQYEEAQGPNVAETKKQVAGVGGLFVLHGPGMAPNGRQKVKIFEIDDDTNPPTVTWNPSNSIYFTSPTEENSSVGIASFGLDYDENTIEVAYLVASYCKSLLPLDTRCGLEQYDATGELVAATPFHLEAPDDHYSYMGVQYRSVARHQNCSKAVIFIGQQTPGGTQIRVDEEVLFDDGA